MGAYELSDGRFIQLQSKTEAVNAHYAGIGPVPEGKVWTILMAFGSTSADDTQDYWFAVADRSGIYYSITRPAEHAFDVSEYNWLPMLTEGMELTMWPGDYLYFKRDGHVAGSTITITARYIETDLPFYKYSEPLKPVVDRTQKHSSAFRGGISAKSGTGTGTIGGGHIPGGGGGGALPV